MSAVEIAGLILLILILLAAGGSIAFGISSYVSTAARMHAEIDQ